MRYAGTVTFMQGLAAIALLATLTLAVLPAAEAPSTAVVLQPVANMYSRPSLDADVVSQAIYGANVGLIEQKDGFAHIRTADDYTGWTPVSALLAGKPYAKSGRVGEVQSLFAHIYREASVTKHAPIVTVPFEAKLEVVSEPDADARWYQVRLPDDHAGWIQAGDLSLTPKVLSIPETLEFSKRFLGLPYTWGGTSSYGYDCSGFPRCWDAAAASACRATRSPRPSGAASPPSSGKISRPATYYISAVPTKGLRIPAFIWETASSSTQPRISLRWCESMI